MQSGLPLEHTFRLFKQVLGWTAPKIRDPHAADRWTWLIITAHTQLRLARPLAIGTTHCGCSGTTSRRFPNTCSAATSVRSAVVSKRWST